jgi:hypothetical protein
MEPSSRVNIASSRSKISHLTAGLLLWFAAGCGQLEDSTKLPVSADGKVQLTSLSNEKIDPLANQVAIAQVFLFTRVDCPISNRYAPEVNRLYAEFQPKGIEFYLVYPDPDQTLEGIRQHMAEYGYSCGAFHDPEHSLVAKSDATITPEAAVYLRNGQLVYRGRIDDRFVDFGKQRIKPSVSDLDETLSAIVSGNIPEFHETAAVGCYISDLRPRN